MSDSSTPLQAYLKNIISLRDNHAYFTDKVD